jgi:hypothetical protein
MKVTWDCKTVKVNTELGDYTNVVSYVDWKVIATTMTVEEEILSEELTGTQEISMNEDSDFISFNDLSNDIVYGWVKDAIGQEKVYELERSVLSALQEKVTPKYVTMTIGS